MSQPSRSPCIADPGNGPSSSIFPTFMSRSIPAVTFIPRFPPSLQGAQVMREGRPQVIATWTRNLLLFLLLPLMALSVLADGKAADPININTATAEVLAAQLERIGPVRAEAIVSWRQKHGKFSTVDELAVVPGISQAVVDLNRERMTTE